MGETQPRVTIEELKEMLAQMITEIESPFACVSDPTLQRARDLIELSAPDV